jgi:hypothetical protein
MQTDPETKSGGTQTGDPLMYGMNRLMFDITMDAAADEALEEADTVMEAAREEEDRQNQKIKEIVAIHNGEEVKDLPFLRQSTASSSNMNPKPAEDKPRSRSRSPKPVESGDLGGASNKPQKVVREDTGGENTKRRGRKPKPVGSENTQQQKVKRRNSREAGEVSSSAKAKAKSEKKAEAPEVKAIKAALKAALKAEVKASKDESRQNKKDADLAAEAAEATGEAASSSTRKHGVGLIENKSMSFWKESKHNDS